MSTTLEQNTIEKNDEIENIEIIENYTLTFENEDDTKNTSKHQGFSEEIDEFNKESLETTALVTIKERRILAMQTMFKKSIRVSLKSFLISLSRSFLNLFI